MVINRKQRNFRGSGISELGPALLLLLIVTFFPFLNLITIGLSFGVSWYLNHYCCQQLALNDSNAGTVAAVKEQVNTSFLQTGLARYLGVTDSQQIRHDVTFAPSVNGQPATVSVATELDTRPLVFIPFFEGVPGLDGAARFRINTSRVREELD